MFVWYNARADYIFQVQWVVHLPSAYYWEITVILIVVVSHLTP